MTKARLAESLARSNMLETWLRDSAEALTHARNSVATSTGPSAPPGIVALTEVGKPMLTCTCMVPVTIHTILPQESAQHHKSVTFMMLYYHKGAVVELFTTASQAIQVIQVLLPCGLDGNPPRAALASQQ